MGLSYTTNPKYSGTMTNMPKLITSDQTLFGITEVLPLDPSLPRFRGTREPQIRLSGGAIPTTRTLLFNYLWILNSSKRKPELQPLSWSSLKYTLSLHRSWLMSLLPPRARRELGQQVRKKRKRRRRIRRKSLMLVKYAPDIERLGKRLMIRHNNILNISPDLEMRSSYSGNTLWTPS
jgi:hypothetical protein